MDPLSVPIQKYDNHLLFNGVQMPPFRLVAGGIQSNSILRPRLSIVSPEAVSRGGRIHDSQALSVAVANFKLSCLNALAMYRSR
jgi:hypothetical protein